MNVGTLKKYTGLCIEKRKDVMRAIIIFEVIYMLIVDGVFLSLPVVSSFHYVLDLANIVLIGGLVIDVKDVLKIKDKWIFIPWILYAAVCIISVAVNSIDILLFLWAVRNTFRFVIFFLSCIVYVRKDDVKKFMKLMLNLQFINFPIVVIQYIYCKINKEVIEGIWLDHIGGIFGMETGCSGRLNIYLAVIFIIALAELFEKEKITWRFLFISLSAILCASFSEIKFFVAESIILLFVLTVLYIKKVRFTLTLETVLIHLLFCLIGVVVMHYAISPLATKALNNYNRYELMASDVYQISRSHAFSQINSLFFDNDVMKKIFGLGFGNCEFAKFSFLISDFYKQYGEYNYRWFSHQMIYLETGYAGFITFAGIFVTVAIQSFKTFLKDNSNRFMAAVAVAVAALTFVNLWYNNAIRTDLGYINYFLLAVCMIFTQRDFEKENSFDELNRTI